MKAPELFFASSEGRKPPPPRIHSLVMSQRIPLTSDGSSWVEYHPNVLHLTEQEYADLWNLHPETRGTIHVHGKTHVIRRWNQSYGRSYTFSGQVAEAAKEMPEIVQRCMDMANERERREAEEAKEEKEAEEKEEDAQHAAKRARTSDEDERLPSSSFNMALVNWYLNGEDYIAAHSDDERQLVPGEPIACFSFGATRKFHLRPKDGMVARKGAQKVDLMVEDGSLLIMGGECQRTHTHSIPVSKKVKDSRISITLRKFV